MKYDWNSHIASDGLYTDRPGQSRSSGDALIITLVFVLARKAVGEWTKDDEKALGLVLETCIKRGYKGLPVRNPKKQREQISQDVLFAIQALCVLCNRLDIARNIYKHGRNSDPQWIYNNKKVHHFPFRGTKHPWFGRYPHLVCHIKLATQYPSPRYARPDDIEYFLWNRSINNGIRDYGKNAEAATFTVAKIEVGKRSTRPEYRRLARKYEREFLKKGGLGMGLRKWGKNWNPKRNPAVRALRDAGF